MKNFKIKAVASVVVAFGMVIVLSMSLFALTGNSEVADLTENILYMDDNT